MLGLSSSSLTEDQDEIGDTPSHGGPPHNISVAMTIVAIIIASPPMTTPMIHLPRTTTHRRDSLKARPIQA